MKGLLLLIFIALGANLLSQNSSDVYLGTRWIAIQPSEENQDLFATDSNGQNIYEVIKELAIANKIKLYQAPKNRKYQEVWDEYPKQELDPDDPLMRNASYINPVHSYFRKYEVLDEPMKNKSGEYSMYIYEDGSQAFLYEDLYRDFVLSDFNEIRIMEEMRPSENVHEDELVAARICFSVHSSLREDWWFWVDLYEVYDAVRDVQDHKWHEALIEMSYSGFQYAQGECVEGEQRNYYPPVQGVDYRWVSLKNTPQNKRLFSTNEEFTTMTDILQSLAAVNSLGVNNESRNPPNYEYNWYKVPYIEEKTDLESISENPMEVEFILSDQSTIPLTNEYGDDLTKVNDEGEEEYLYPQPRVFWLSYKYLEEIIVKEDYYYDHLGPEPIISVVGFSFVMKYPGQEAREIFWIDMNNLSEKIDNLEELNWYNALLERDYEGFNFLQVEQLAFK
jgi:hypothetical protein